MGTSKQANDHLLKLVHPGGFVDLHTKPLTAAQVMKKNPRHCVTRPDVFKFPWIVVRPDSVLKLGTVYFIVPNHTLYRLLRASGARRQTTLLHGPRQSSQVGHQHSVEEPVVENWIELTPEVQQSSYQSWAEATPKRRDRRRNKQTSQVGSCDEGTPKNEHHGRQSKQQNSDRSSGKMVQKKQPSCFMMPPRLHDRDQQSPVKHSTVKSFKHIHHDQHLPKDSSNDSLDQVTSYSSNKKLDTSNLFPKQDSWLLKPCLRKAKDKNHPKSHGRKVTFLLPSKDDDKRHKFRIL